MNWLIVAWISFFVYGSIFAYGLVQKRWTKAGLLVAVFNLFVAFMNSVAPVRGWADPDYFGFSLGFLRMPQGPGVTLVSGSIFIGAIATFSIALLNKTGRPMAFVALFDGLLGTIVVRSNPSGRGPSNGFPQLPDERGIPVMG